MTKTCYASVEGMIKVGEVFSETESMVFASSKYIDSKTEWIKWKKMLNQVAKSDMKFTTLLNIAVYKIFEPNGLYEQGVVWQKKELQASKDFITKEKVWDFNMKMPESCNTTGKSTASNNTIKGSCAPIRAWLTARGVSDDAASMANFRVDNQSNISLADVNTNLVVFDKFEKSMASPENVAETEEWAKKVFGALENDTSTLQDLLKNMTGKEQRVLAEEEIEIVEAPDSDNSALNPGFDGSIDDTELEDFAEINQDEPIQYIEVADSLQTTDTGVVGPDSTVDSSTGGSSGSSFMKWVMYIGGAILVMALIAGACFLVQ